MSIDNKSKFLDIQEDICEIVPPEEPSVKICPTCVPDKGAITPNWWEEREPFLDKRDCSYSVTVAINDDGESFDVARMTSEGRNIKQLAETYKRFGILQLMRFYNKEISNETLFAFPDDPEKLERLNQNANRKIENSVQVLEQQLPNGVFNIYDIPGPVLDAFEIKEGDKFNPFAAELFVKANDYYISTYQTAKGGEPILVQVTIPAFIFDRIPKAKPAPVTDIQKEVVLGGLDLKAQIRRLQIAMGVFGKYQAYWWQTEKGRLVFQKTLPADQELTVDDAFGSSQGLKDFYCTLYGNRLDSFVERLESLIEGQTRFRFRRVRTPRAVQFIKISFNNSNPERPYQIKKIEVKGEGCDYERVPLGSIKRPTVDGGEKFAYPFNDQTILSYVANINDIDQDLQSKETPPWVDFCLKYTFPPLDIEYGKENDLTAEFGQPETILGCVVDNMGGPNAIRDFFLEEIIGFFDAIAYKWNQNNCKALAGTYVTREEQLQKNPKLKATAGELAQQDKDELGAPYDAEIQALQKDIADYNIIIADIEEQLVALNLELENRVTNPSSSLDGPTYSFIELTDAIADFDDQLEAGLSGIDEIKEKINKLEKEKRSAVSPIGEEQREARQRQRENDRNQRRSDRDDRDNLVSVRKTKKALKKDLDDLNRGDRGDIRRQARDESNRGQRRTDRLDRRQQKGERLGSNPFVAASREMVSKQFPFEDSLVQLFLSEEEYKQFGIRGFDFMGGLRDAGNGIRGENKEGKIKSFLSRLGVCGLTKLGQRALECLLSGVDLSTGLRAIVKATLGNMTPTAMERLLVGLDPRVQQDIKQQIEREFGNMPAPWEVGYKPGSKSGVAGESREVAVSNKMDSLETQVEQLQELLDSISNEELFFGGNADTIRFKEDVEIKVTVLSGDEYVDFTPFIAKIQSLKVYTEGADKQGNIEDQLEIIKKDLTNELSLQIAALDAEIIQTQLDEDNTDFRNWRNLSEEEQNELIEREKQTALEFANGATSSEKVSQGSIGKALGNIQETIFDAYVDAILDNVEIQELFSILDKIPGARLIARLIASFDCPNVHFIYPPVRSFLGSLTFDDCLDRGSVSIPRIPRIPKIKDIRERLLTLAKEIVKSAWNDLKQQVFAAASLKFLMIIENALCKSLEAVGQFAAEATQGPNANFGDVINELICGGDTDDNEIDDVSSSLLSSIGVTPQKLQDLSEEINAADLKGQYRQVMDSISNVISGKELKQLIVANPGEADPLVLDRISRTVALQNPAFALFFDSPDKVESVFAAMGNFMTPEQRQLVRDNLANPQIQPDSGSSICLTQEQLLEFEDKKRNIWATAGLDSETIDEALAKDRDRNREAIFVTADLLAKGPAGIFQDAIDKAFLPEECGNVNGIIPLEDEFTSKENDTLVEGVFRSLQKSYQNDMIGKADAFLENVLGDTTDLPLKRHERRANSESFYIDYANSNEDWDAKKKRFDQTAIGRFYFGLLSDESPKGVFPDTVAIKMKEELEAQTFDVNFVYSAKQRPGKETKTVRSGLLGKQTELQVPRPYLKKPDVSLNFSNDKDFNGKLDIDLSFTKFKNNKIQIQKDFGYKIYLYSTIEVSADLDNDGESDKIFNTTQLEYGIFSPQQISDSLSGALLPYDVSLVDLNEKKIPYQSYILANFVNSQLQSASHAPISPTLFNNKFYQDFTQKTFDVVSKGLLETLDGETSDGFSFGYQGDPLTPADLLYVDPESDPNDDSTWEYTYEEEDAVLGRSATKNSRVHFLDPNTYGGRFRSPPMYIEPTTYTGWLGLSQIIVPEIDGCKPKRTDFLDIKQIAENVRKVETSIPQDPRLNEDPDCVKRIPFDKISDASTLAFLDGTVTATIRTYVSEAMLKSMPMFSFLEYSDRNYDDGFAQLIVQEMDRGLQEQEALFGGRIEGYNYYLLFLEQAVQSAVRKIDNGEIESTPEIEEARKEINQAQEDYIYPQVRDLETIKDIKVFNPASNSSSRASVLLGGITTSAFPTYASNKSVIEESLQITTAFLTINEIRFSSKISLINSLRRPCKVLLKALVDNELKFLSSKLEGDDRFRPYVADLSKYYLSLPDFMYGSTLKAGLMDIEKPKVAGELDMNYGDVSEVSPQPTLTDKLTELGLTSDQLSSVAEQGGLFIEKYIRTIDKPRQGPSLQNETREDQQDPPYLQVIRQRPETLKGVCNIAEFRQWASVAKEQIPNELNISDLFGDAFVSTGTTGDYQGSVGIKYGVRISMLPNETLKAELSTGNWDSEAVAREKSYRFADTSAIPLVSYEKDIKDIKFNDLDFSDENLGEDLKCYIDKLVTTEEYQLIMDNLLGLRRIPTIMSIYMNYVFLDAVGSSESERDDDAKLLGFIDRTSDTWKSEILEDTKKECRRLFAAFYRSDDFEPEDDNDASLRDVLSRFLPGVFGVNRGLLNWRRRRKLRNRPFDKNGNQCKNAFQRVFSSD
jgi:hypothetical protein